MGKTPQNISIHVQLGLGLGLGTLPSIVLGQTQDIEQMAGQLKPATGERDGSGRDGDHRLSEGVAAEAAYHARARTRH
jgi:hypothetical protein